MKNGGTGRGPGRQRGLDRATESLHVLTPGRADEPRGQHSGHGQARREARTTAPAAPPPSVKPDPVTAIAIALQAARRSPRSLPVRPVPSPDRASLGAPALAAAVCPAGGRGRLPSLDVHLIRRRAILHLTLGGGTWGAQKHSSVRVSREERPR